MTEREADLLALLRELDDPDWLEWPRNYDRGESAVRFGALVARLEVDFAARCAATTEQESQDSSEYGRVTRCGPCMKCWRCPRPDEGNPVKLTIERATESDAQAIAIMLGEIERYNGGPDEVPDVKPVHQALFGPRPAATVLLARDDDQVIGLASVGFLWPAVGAETSLYLKELYVQEAYRRRGVARDLMVAVRNEAQAAGCSRVEWTADRDNPPAVALYAALGVEPHEGKIFYRSQL